MDSHRLARLVSGLLAPFLFLFLLSCSDDGGGPSDPGSSETIPTETRSGTLSVPSGTGLSPDQFEVVTLAGRNFLGADGSFSLSAPTADKYQLLFFRPQTGNKASLIGLFNPVSKVVAASDSSTAQALTLLNPYLIHAGQAEKEMYLSAMRGNTKYGTLLSLLGAAYQADPAAALDFDRNPSIFQTAAELMRETMVSLGGGGTPPALVKDPPTVEDGEGGKIRLLNSRQVPYVAAVYDQSGALDRIVTVGTKETALSYQWGWPPVVGGAPEATELDLGDGTYRVQLTRGGDFSKISDWNDPEGRATAISTAHAVSYLLELAVGRLAKPDVEDLAGRIQVSAGRALALQAAADQEKPESFMSELCGLVSDNAGVVAEWLWGGRTQVGAADFLEDSFRMLGKVPFVLEQLGYVNDQGPLLWDMVTAQQEVTYVVTQEGGVLTSTVTNDPPVAEFTVTPPAGIVGTVFQFDPATSSDGQDPLDSLEFRWDWENDGTWDVNWGSSAVRSHSFSEAGAQTVRLEVRDTGGLIGSVSHTVTVGGGAGTATHVKVFRDDLPWNTNALVEVLEELGFTEGTGESTYEIIASGEMGTVTLVPGEDLVIISNDQDQTFYDNYAASQVRFTNFVYGGGALFWEACDRGWQGGSIDTAGITLPGNLVTEVDEDFYNYVVNQSLPLVAGLPDTMDHNNASHESFGNLPEGATVYCVNEEDEPTLVEFPLGSGWVVVSGQPLEHQYTYIYGSPDMEELLPRVVAYFTGRSIDKAAWSTGTFRSPSPARSTSGRRE